MLCLQKCKICFSTHSDSKDAMEVRVKGEMDAEGVGWSSSRSSQCFALLSDGSDALDLFQTIDFILGAILLESPMKSRRNDNGRGLDGVRN